MYGAGIFKTSKCDVSKTSEVCQLDIEGINGRGKKMIVDKMKFEHVYRQLLTITRQKDPDHKHSFSAGYWNDEEGYKRVFWTEALQKLELDNWNNFTPHEIVSHATQPFGVLMSGSYRKQNLVSENNYMKLFELFTTREKEAAYVLYDIFSEIMMRQPLTVWQSCYPENQ